MATDIVFLSLFFYYIGPGNTVPPAQCFANFKWDDCGGSPKPVMYYWKPGSRCEVGIWRGCLPNVNMFKDEYECVSTCIFAVRAAPSDYHDQNYGEERTEDIDYNMVTTKDSVTDTSSTMSGNGTDNANVSTVSNPTSSADSPSGMTTIETPDNSNNNSANGPSSNT